MLQNVKKLSNVEYSEYYIKFGHNLKYKYIFKLIRCMHKVYWLIDKLGFNATFNNISAISWRPVFSGGGSRSTRREPLTLGKQLVSFITCSCESSAPFFVINKAGRELTPYWW